MEIVEFIKKALSETDMTPSSLRVMSFLGFVQWSILISFGFIWVLVFYPYLVTGYLTILSGLLATVLGLKVWQRGKENE